MGVHFLCGVKMLLKISHMDASPSADLGFLTYEDRKIPTYRLQDKKSRHYADSRENGTLTKENPQPMYQNE